jgi:uncharacterized surface protein with fasciclin (FAS1) repeats
MRTSRTRLAALGLIVAVSLTAAACSSDEDSSSSDGDSTTTEMEASTTTMADDSGDDMSGGSEMALEPSGPACSAVPADGAGSFAGMAEDPAATAASNNPLLSTLVSAVGAANLGDTLNGPGPFTIFAPVNDAFAEIPADTLNAVLADVPQLTDILTYHVVPEQMSSTDLIEAGMVTTVEGGELTIEESGDSFTVNGANVLCADVPTANATVFLIDTVMMPA